MAQTVKSLEQRIRDKAKEDLIKSIQAALISLNQLCGHGDTKTGWKFKGHDSEVEIGHVLQSLPKLLLEQMLPRAENDALEAFMKQADHLQEQLDDLRHQVQS